VSVTDRNIIDHEKNFPIEQARVPWSWNDHVGRWGWIGWGKNGFAARVLRLGRGWVVECLLGLERISGKLEKKDGRHVYLRHIVRLEFRTHHVIATET